MFKIIEKKQLSAGVFYMKVTAPEIARNRKAGQFVIVQVDLDFGERIPLTIADANAEEGWIALVFQAVGASTLKLSLKEVHLKSKNMTALYLLLVVVLVLLHVTQSFRLTRLLVTR